MGQDVSNIGQTGIESIRINGVKPEDLPIREQAVTREQMPDVIENDRQNQIRAIEASYPTQRVPYLKGCVVECKENIKRIRDLKAGQEKMVNDYSVHIGLCDHRDRLIAKLDAEKDAAEIKKLKLQYPPYNVKAMKQQIRQCKEAIVRADVVVDKEFASISELEAMIHKCQERDQKLKQLGVDVG
jgi:hypothetical protein